MAHIKKSQKEKTSNKRSHRFSEKFSIPFGRISDFYRAVSILNNELGHGNWTTTGRPVRKLRRVDQFNRISFTANRTIDVVFHVPCNVESVLTRVSLEILR